jgi:hypothetical protein
MLCYIFIATFLDKNTKLNYVTIAGRIGMEKGNKIMRKKFNDTGLCITGRHYMVDISGKIEQIIRLVEDGEYFAISRPRQFGKTTMLSLLNKQLNLKDDYQTFSISFEGIGDVPFTTEQNFCKAFLRLIARSVRFTVHEIADYFEQASQEVHDFEELSLFISQYVFRLKKHLVLLIDEIDKSSDNQIFLHFLGMLRSKYLLRGTGQDYTFQSVILAGVHDIKTLKTQIRSDDEKKYNSPWNIAIDFEVDLSFNPGEIETMLQDFSQDKNFRFDTRPIAERLYYYTSGYPYLVSKLCKFIDERIIIQRKDNEWSVNDVEIAFKMIVNEAYTTTLFDNLTKNLENNRKLYDNVFNIVINGKRVPFNITVPVINKGYLYGIFAPSSEGCKIHNRIYEQRIYSYMITKLLTSNPEPIFSLQPDYYTDDALNIEVILLRFQNFMKEHYASHDAKFLEREGRLLFLSYLRPIINGKGFDFKEPNVSEERRMDIVITFLDKRYVIELKIWHGLKYHQEGLKQLSRYLDTYSLEVGYLLIYNFNKNKEYKQERIKFENKQIFAVWV